MENETDPIKKLWLHPAFVRLRKPMLPWFMAIMYLVLVCVIGILLFGAFTALKALGPVIPIIILIVFCIVMVRYTVFKDR